MFNGCVRNDVARLGKVFHSIVEVRGCGLGLQVGFCGVVRRNAVDVQSCR